MSYKEELVEKLIDWKISFHTLKEFLYFISLSIKYLPIKLE